MSATYCSEKPLPFNPTRKSSPPNPTRNPLPPNPTRYRTLQITLVSATNLPGRRLPYLHPQPMKVYAEVSLITGDSPITIENAAGNVDNDGETTWDLNLKVGPMTLPHSTPNQTSPQLIVKLSRRSMGYHIYIGRVDICVNTLLQKWHHSHQNVSQNDDFEVKDTSNGKLKISYSFGETNQEQRPTHI